MKWVEERSLLKTRKVSNKESLICSIIGRLEVRVPTDSNKRSKTLEEIVIGCIVGSNHEETSMEVAGIHIYCTEMTTLKEIINVMEEDIIGIHVDYTFVVKHIPYMQLV